MSLTFYLLTAAVVLLLVTGLYSLLATKNLIRILISLEILMKAATLLIITVGYAANRVALAQVMAITLIIVEVVAVAVAMGIVVGIHRHNGTLDTRKLRNLKG